ADTRGSALAVSADHGLRPSPRVSTRRAAAGPSSSSNAAANQPARPATSPKGPSGGLARCATNGAAALTTRVAAVHTTFAGVRWSRIESPSAPPAACHIVQVIGVAITRATGMPPATYTTKAPYAAHAMRGVRRSNRSMAPYTSSTAASCQMYAAGDHADH